MYRTDTGEIKGEKERELDSTRSNEREVACLVPGVVLLQPLAACRVLQHPGMTARPVLYPRTWLWLQSDRFSPQSLEVGILYISRGSFCRLQACFADRGLLLRVVVVLSAWADCLAENICMRAQAPARPPRPVFLRNPHGSAAAAWPFGGRRFAARLRGSDGNILWSKVRMLRLRGRSRRSIFLRLRRGFFPQRDSMRSLVL